MLLCGEGHENYCTIGDCIVPSLTTTLPTKGYSPKKKPCHYAEYPIDTWPTEHLPITIHPREENIAGARLTPLRLKSRPPCIEFQSIGRHI